MPSRYESKLSVLGWKKSHGRPLYHVGQCRAPKWTVCAAEGCDHAAILQHVLIVGGFFVVAACAYHSNILVERAR